MVCHLNRMDFQDDYNSTNRKADILSPHWHSFGTHVGHITPSRRSVYPGPRRSRPPDVAKEKQSSLSGHIDQRNDRQSGHVRSPSLCRTPECHRSPQFNGLPAPVKISCFSGPRPITSSLRLTSRPYRSEIAMLENKTPGSRQKCGSRHSFGPHGNMTAMSGGLQIGIGMRKGFAQGNEGQTYSTPRGS
jgi:hypothetical protein